MFKYFFIFFITCSIVEADWRFSNDSYLSHQQSEVIESEINFNNQVLRRPQAESQLIVRPDIRWQGSKTQWVLRPELLVDFLQIENTDKTDAETKSNSEVDLKDFFIQNELSRKITSIIGLQSFQWGPAELLSPSNPLFHFNSGQKGFLYKEKGKVLVRLNFILDKQNSIVLVAEPASSQEKSWIYDEEFKPRGLIKYEMAADGLANYFGLSAGIEDKENLFVGGYFSYSPNEAFSVYSDVKVSQYKINFEPQVVGGVVNFVEAFDPKEQWHPLAILGIRWESSFDWRLEYIYNSAGFTQDELKLAQLSAGQILNPNFSKNLSTYLQPGLELLGQSYIYSSLRVSDFFSFKEINFFARVIYSQQDQSSLSQIELDKGLSDSTSGFVSYSSSFGEEESEFRLLNSWTVGAGLKWSL